MPMKLLKFVGSSLNDLRSFPEEVRREAGFQLDTVQRGGMPSDFKLMLSIGAGAYEIRLHIQGRMADHLCGKNSQYRLHPACIPEKDAENQT